jgi:hypothetical protein
MHCGHPPDRSAFFVLEPQVESEWNLGWDQSGTSGEISCNLWRNQLESHVETVGIFGGEVLRFYGKIVNFASWKRMGLECSGGG